MLVPWLFKRGSLKSSRDLRVLPETLAHLQARFMRQTIKHTVCDRIAKAARRDSKAGTVAMAANSNHCIPSMYNLFSSSGVIPEERRVALIRLIIARMDNTTKDVDSTLLAVVLRKGRLTM